MTRLSGATVRGMICSLLGASALVFAVPSASQGPASSATPAPASTPATAPPPAEAPKPRVVPVALLTSLGPIMIDVEIERAPITAANFLRYVDQKRLDGTHFYRGFTFETQPNYGLIQGGTANAPARVLKPVAHEPTTKTGLTHGDGAVSMARGAPGTATGDFFIIVGGLDSLDANPKAPGDNQGFAVFGRVTQGMEIVRQIANAPKDPVKGAAGMKGQMLIQPIRIIRASRYTPAVQPAH